jgi:hypothetical protein
MIKNMQRPIKEKVFKITKLKKIKSIGRIQNIFSNNLDDKSPQPFTSCTYLT